MGTRDFVSRFDAVLINHSVSSKKPVIYLTGPWASISNFKEQSSECVGNRTLPARLSWVARLHDPQPGRTANLERPKRPEPASRQPPRGAFCLSRSEKGMRQSLVRSPKQCVSVKYARLRVFFPRAPAGNGCPAQLNAVRCSFRHLSCRQFFEPASSCLCGFRCFCGFRLKDCRNHNPRGGHFIVLRCDKYKVHFFVVPALKI